MNKILSIVIPVFNKYNFTKSCLKDLSQLSNDHEIIIIDNGSTDETKSQLKNSKEIVYKEMGHNSGFASGCNYGYLYSSAPNVLFLNNDIRVKSNYSDWTKPLIDKCSDALCGPTMGLLNDKLEFVMEADGQLPTKRSYLSGWCIASSKEIWQKLDISGNKEIFSEEFFCYFEDTDLSFRAREKGIQLSVVDIPVVHFGKISSKQLNTYKLYKNARSIFIKKWEKHIIK